MQLLTGTPGVGKSTLCKELVKVTDFDWIDVSKFAIEHDCIFEVDNEFKCSVIDEDKVSSNTKILLSLSTFQSTHEIKNFFERL